MKMKQRNPACAACAATELARLPVDAHETVSNPNSIALVSATLTTATPMAPELAARAAAALEKLVGRKVNLQTQIDPALLGGAVTQVGSMVYDGSLKTQLARLRRTMGEE